MRERRGALTAGVRSRASRNLCLRLVRHPYFIAARHIGMYYPNDGEIDPTAAANGRAGRRFYLPVLPPRGKRRLWFAPYAPGSRLVWDRYGIPEPTGRTKIRAEKLDLLLVPLVAFDRDGGRIGMGGGFYDASLTFLQRPGRINPTRVIGVAYHFQQIESIPVDDWDIPLHGVITDMDFIQAPVLHRVNQ